MLIRRPCRMYFILVLLGFRDGEGCLELPGIVSFQVKTLQFDDRHEAQIATRIQPSGC